MQSSNQMLTGSLPKLMVKMAVPSVIAQMINVLYSIVDRIYIGHIPMVSDAALTGVGITFPIITFISAFAAFAGAGGAPLASIYQGRGNREKAEQVLGSCVLMLVFFAAMLMLVFYLFLTPILYLFGASETTEYYARSYISVYLLGTLFTQLSLGLNPYITAQGNSKTAMLTVLIGAVLNLVLDPILIFGFHMGVAGAAWATVAAQAVSALWVVLFLTGPRAVLRIRPSCLVPNLPMIGRIASLGISPFTMQSTSSLVGVVMNAGMQHYGGDLYVASLTVFNSLTELIRAPLNGFTQGVQPIISCNFGASQFSRARRTALNMIAVCTGFSFVLTACFMIFPEQICAVFTGSPALIALCAKKAPVYLAGMLLFGIQRGIQPTFMALGQAIISIFIALLRKIILLIPLALILPVFWGVNGIYWAESISDVLSSLTAMLLYLLNIKKILTPEALGRI